MLHRALPHAWHHGQYQQYHQNPSGTPNFQVGLPSETVQVNGSLDSGNGTVAFYLDGGNNITGMRNYGNPAPNPDAVEEVRVDTSAFAAEYGQFSGAMVSVITKSERISSTAVCSSSTATLTSMPGIGIQLLLHKSPLPPQPVWRNRRRPHQARQVLLLLQLCRPEADTKRNSLRRYSAHGLPSARVTLPSPR